jgi:hypothetical protein
MHCLGIGLHNWVSIGLDRSHGGQRSGLRTLDPTLTADERSRSLHSGCLSPTSSKDKPRICKIEPGNCHVANIPNFFPLLCGPDSGVIESKHTYPAQCSSSHCTERPTQKGKQITSQTTPPSRLRKHGTIYNCNCVSISPRSRSLI